MWDARLLMEVEMKKWLFLLGIAVFIVGCENETAADAKASGGDPTVEAEEHVDWITDFEKAKTLANAEGKHILIDFSGSDWCGWCIRLDNEVFSKKAFKEYAEDNLVLMLADFPRDKSNQSAALQKQNNTLLEKFGVRGFPTVFILNPEGTVIAKTGYQDGGAEAYVEYIKKTIAASQ
jgi:protein disulfide-isomerase